MRIVVNEFMSLDGVVQAPGGAEEDTDGGFAHGGWSMPHFDVEAMGGALDELLGQTEALLFGRRTFQVMAAAWPDRAGDPFADRMNGIEKHVVTGTLSQDDVTWQNSTVIHPDRLREDVQALRDRDGGVLQVMGSAQLARTLLAEDLVDEVRIMLEPVLLGGGKRIFPEDGQARQLELVEAVPTKTGVLMCTYRPVGR